jgi:hypothetical protein
MKSARRSMRRSIATTLSAVLAVMLGPALVGAGPFANATVSTPTLTWSGPIRLAHDGLSAFINSVACPTATQCTAVDSFGREVTYDPTNPGDPVPYVLDSGQTYVAIACPTTTECVTVSNNGREVEFDPTTPAGATTPRSLAATATRGLACPTATQCTTVDDTGHELTFDPTTTASATNVTVDTGHQLNGVVCPSSSQCTAIDNAGNEVTFDPTSPGSPTPASIDSTTTMNGVSCPSTSQCTAVDSLGQVVTFDPITPGAPTPVLIDSGKILTDIMCPSTSRCVAIDNAHHEYAFDPTNVGSPTQNTIGSVYLLTSLDCPSATQCTLVDNGGRTTTVDPTAVGTPTLVAVAGRDNLPSISCPSATQCTAIDDLDRVVTFDPTAPGTPMPAVLSTSSLKSIACPSTTQCTAVDIGGKELTFNPATPGTHTSVSLSLGSAPAAVACPSATLCVAIDTAGRRSTFNPTSASPQAATVDFNQTTNAVACPSTTQCTTVDNAGQYVTFGPNDNPTTQYFPAIIDSGQRLFGVACPSTTKCVAVDWIGNLVTFAPSVPSGPVVTLIDSGKVFNYVGCASTTLCVAVDNANRVFEGDPAQPAGWIMQTLPQAVGMQAVACPTSSECVATDSLGNAFLGLALPVNTSLPSITGTTTQGHLLTAADGTWTNSPTSFAYQWQDCDSAGASCTSIAGAIASTYTLQGSDAGHKIRVIVTATNGVGSGTPATSAATAVVLPLPPGNVDPPSISGNTSQGQMLTAGAGTWTNNPTSFAHQWQDCDAAGANCATIDGATGTTYLLQASDVGSTVRVTETATNAGGSSSPVPSAQTAVIAPPDTIAPVVQFDAKPANPTSSRAAHFAFSATDNSPPVTFTCQLDSEPASVCTSPVDRTLLPDGLHTFTVTATDAVSNASSPLAYQWLVDGTAPTATLKTPTAAFVLTATTPVTWAGADAGSGIGSYQVRYQRAAWNALLGPWTYPAAWQALHGTSIAASLPVGYTYCFSVRSIDNAGNASAWTASRCTARPLDDRSGTPSTGWLRGTNSAYYLGTYTQTTGLNRTLVRTGARLDRVGIVVTKCPTCGVVGVYVGTTLVGKVSLYSKTTVRKAVVVLPRFSLRLATVTVKVLSSGKLVQLDGLAISKA